MTDFEEAEWAAGRSYLASGGWKHEGYREHNYRHAMGVVEIYEQLGPNAFVNMRFRYQGRDYVRTWRTSWGDRTLARLARELVESVVE
jgi:hypothetical protein